MATSGTIRKVERLLNDHKSPHPAFFFSTHLQFFQPIYARGLDLFQAKSPEELDLVSSPGVYGCSPM